MGRHRTLLARVRRLEAPVVHPVLAALGGEEGWARFQAEVQEGMADGNYDRRDAPLILSVLRAWFSVSPAPEPTYSQPFHGARR